MKGLRAIVNLRGPRRMTRVHWQAWRAGFRDGWAQPLDLCWTASVDWDLQESLDRGACVGQFLRAPIRHEVWR